MSGRRVLVTGANGYIGSHLVSTLIDHGDTVIAADLSFKYVDQRAERLECDVFKGIGRHLSNVDTVVHLAWKSGFNHGDRCHIDLLPSHVHLLEEVAASGIDRLAVMGTMHEVGYWEGAIYSDTPCFPQSYYGIAKNALRSAASVICAATETKLYWLRGFYFIGDDSRNNSIFSKLNDAISRGDTEFPLNSGRNEYDFINIDEAANQIRLAISQERHTGIINICSGQHVSLANMVCQYVANQNADIDLAWGKYPDRLYDSPVVYGDSTVIKSIIEESGEYEK